MKHIIILLSAVLMVSLSSCYKSEPIGQVPVHGGKPEKIAIQKVENTPGGAIISYTLPNMTDISYVRAEYMYKGKPVSTKSTVYTNTVTIEGFGSTDPVDVNLYTVDHSENSSDAVKVTINPQKPPVFLITGSFVVQTDFGGPRLQWTNPTGDEIVITLVAKDENGKYADQATLYSNGKSGNYSFRGFKSEPTSFGLCVRDKYRNYSDTVKFDMTPFYEIKIPTTKFARVTGIPRDNLTQYNTTTWSFPRLWDGITTADAGWCALDASCTVLPLYFTIDIGTDTKLSRIKVYHRSDAKYLYKHYNPKVLEVWGSTGFAAGQPISYYEKGGPWETDGKWDYLGTYKTFKPSGDGLEVTIEDRAYGLNGFEFMMPLVDKKYRYIRFGMLENWSGSANANIAEIEFFGDNR